MLHSFEASFNPRGLYRGAGSRGLNRSCGFFWHMGNSFHSFLLASQGYSSSWSGAWPKNFSLTIWDNTIWSQFHFIFGFDMNLRRDGLHLDIRVGLTQQSDMPPITAIAFACESL